MHLRLTPASLWQIDHKSQNRSELPGFDGPGYEMAIAHALFGMPTAQIRKTVRRQAELGRLRIDGVSAALIAHLGINPAVIAMLTTFVDDLEIVDPMQPVGDATVLVMRDAGARIRLSHDVVWDAEMATITMPNMPEQLLATIVGGPLERLISHPALDPLGLTVTARVQVPFHPRFNVRPRRWLTRHEIAAYLGDE